MRLYELEAEKFFLDFDERQEKGSIVTRIGSVFPLGVEREGQLERNRPPNALPRSKSMYLLSHVPQSTTYVYEVQPLGQVDRHHTGWLSELATAPTGAKGATDQFSSGYWTETPYPDRQNDRWEHRAMEVKIVRRVGGSGR